MRQPAALGIADAVAELKDGVVALAAGAEAVLPEHYRRDLRARAERLTGQGVPEALARRMAGLVNLYAAGDVIGLAGAHGRSVVDAGAAYYAIGTRFRLGRLRAACEALDAGSHWQKLAAGAGRKSTAISGLGGPRAGGGPFWSVRRRGGAAVERWLAAHAAAGRGHLGELWATPVTELAQVAVASRHLRADASDRRTLKFPIG